MSVSNVFNLGASDSYNAGPGSNWQFNINIWKLTFDFTTSNMYVWVRGSWSSTGFTISNTDTNIQAYITYSDLTTNNNTNTSLDFPNNNNTYWTIPFDGNKIIATLYLYVYGHINITSGGGGGDKTASNSTTLAVVYDNNSAIVVAYPGGSNRLYLLNNANQYSNSSILKFIKATNSNNIYLSSKYGQVIDRFSDNTIPEIPSNACVGLVADGLQWWIISYYPGGFGTGTLGFGSGTSSGTISSSVTFHKVTSGQVGDIAYDLPDPTTFSSSLLILIQQGTPGKNNKFYLNSTVNNYLYDNSQGIYCFCGGYGGGNNGNASIVLISDKSRWYVAVVQGSEYINYTTTAYTATNILSSSITYTSISYNGGSPTTTSFQPISISSLANNQIKLFFLKKKVQDNTDGPVIQLPNGTGQFIGGQDGGSNNYTQAYAVNQTGPAAYGTPYEGYIMGAMNQSGTNAYYFLGYYPWST